MNRKIVGAVWWSFVLTLAALVLITLCTPAPARGQEPPRSLSITWSASILRQFSFLRQNLRTEFASCLYGTVTRGESVDTLNVQLNVLSMDRPSSFTKDNSSSQCWVSPSWAGTVHSHTTPSDSVFSPLDDRTWRRLQQTYRDSAIMFLDVLVYDRNKMLIRTANGFSYRCSWDPEQELEFLRITCRESQ